MSSGVQNDRKNYNEGLKDLQQSYQDKRKQIVKENEAELNQLKTDYSEKKQNEIDTNEAAINHIRGDSQDKMQNLKAQNYQNYQLENQRMRESLEKIRVNYEKESQEIRERHEQNMQSMANLHQREQIETKKQYEQEAQDQHAQFLEKKEKEQSVYRDQLRGQHEEFSHSYSKNDETNKMVLNDQKERMLQALQEQKGHLVKTVGKYQDKSHDPFYQVTKMPTEFQENDRAYIFKAQIPEHEKDNIEVRVQKDKLILSGSRRFEDNLQGDQTRFSTNNYQTFREEWALSYPASEKSIHRTYRDGILTVIIPKAIKT